MANLATLITGNWSETSTIRVSANQAFLRSEARDDHYPVCRLDIRQNNEFATGYTQLLSNGNRIRISETL